MVHREHSPYFCVFAGNCILSRCLTMGQYVTVFTVLHRHKFATTLTNWCLVESSRIESDLSAADAESFVLHGSSDIEGMPLQHLRYLD
jgi:hypothetical protein